MNHKIKIKDTAEQQRGQKQKRRQIGALYASWRGAANQTTSTATQQTSQNHKDIQGYPWISKTTKKHA